MSHKDDLSEIKGYYFTTTDSSTDKVHEKVKIIGRNFLYNEHRSLKDIIDEFKRLSDKYLVAVFRLKNLEDSKTKDNEGNWIGLTVMRKSAMYEILRSIGMMETTSTMKLAVGSEVGSNLLKEPLQRHFDDKMFNFNLVESNTSTNVAAALDEAIKPIITSSIDIPHVFHKSIISQGLLTERKARSKLTLERVLSSLEFLLKSVPGFILEGQQFLNLCKKINSRNFKPKPEEKVDLRIETLKLIAHLKENGQVISKKIDDEEFRSKNGFLTREKTIFLNQITEFDDQLRENPRNSKVKGMLKLVINDRIEYLIIKNKLVPELVMVLDIADIFEHFVLRETIKSFKQWKENIEKTYLETKEELMVRTAVDLTYKLQEMHHQLEYLEVKSSIRFDCHFLQLTEVLSSKQLVDQNVSIDMLQKIFEIGKEFMSESVVTNIIKIMSHLPTGFDTKYLVDEFPVQFFKHLNGETEKQVVELANRGHFGLQYPDELSQLLMTILITNVDEGLRKTALLALTKAKEYSSAEVDALISIEGSCVTGTDLPNVMFLHVESGYRLTWNCFEKLQVLNIDEDKAKIIETIVDLDLQELPKFFVRTIKTEIESMSNVNWSVTEPDKINVLLNIFKSMVVGSYLKISELHGIIISYLKEEKYRENVLLIVMTAIQMGHIISKSILESIKAIQPQTPLVHNCLRALTKEETALDVLKNSRKTIEERKLALYQLTEDKSFHNDYTIRILMNIIRFDQKLRDDAFKVYVGIITPETWKNSFDKFPEVIQSMKTTDSKVPVHIIRVLYKKNFLMDTKLIIDYLIYRAFTGNVKIQMECMTLLKELFIECKCTPEPWITYLRAVINFSRSKEVKLSILRLIKETSNVEEPKQPLEVTFEVVDMQLSGTNDGQVKDEELLSQLVGMVDRGYIVPEETVKVIVQKLFKPDHKLLDLASDAVLLIHSKQTLQPRTLSTIVLEINNRPRLLNKIQLITLLIEAMHVNVVQRPATKIIKKLLNMLKQDQTRNEVKLFVLEALKLYITKFTKDMDSPLKQEFSKVMRDTCMNDGQTTNNMELIIQMKITLETLMLINDSILVDEAFIQKYYEKLKTLVTLTEDGGTLSNLDEFISSAMKTNRIGVLYAVTVTAMCEHQLNANIFIEKEESQWQKEILCNILVRAVFEQSEQFDEILLQNFITELTSLEVYLEETKSSFKVENVLEQLILNKCTKSFEYLIDILCLLKDEDGINLFFDNTLDFDSKILTLLEGFVKRIHPSLSSEELQCMREYRPSTVVKMIETPFEHDSPDDLVNFFNRVKSCLSTKKRELFLVKISSIRSMHGWNHALSTEVVKNLVDQRKNDLTKLATDEAIILLEKKLTRILDSGWEVHSIEVLLNRIIESNHLNMGLSAVDTIYEYQLKEYDSDVKGKALFEIITGNASVNSWNKAFHDIAIFLTFPGTYQKQLTQLVEEIGKLNSGQGIEYLKDDTKMKKDYDKVMEAFNNLSPLKISESKTISEWKDDEIKSWSVKAKAHFGSLTDADVQSFMYEAVAVTMQAVKITYNFLPRDVQLLSLLCMLNTSPNKGRLAQINTGEGKTITIAMLAVIKALRGHTVDIITSSSELAKPQSIELTPFYSLFGISVSHNGDDQEDIKERYKSTILYGTADGFQGDILRDEYSKLGTRSGRKCDLAIVDEVDSMLIDGKNHIVMLSSFMPAMNYLETILAAIYVHIGVVANTIVERDGKTYFIDQQDRIDDNGNLRDDVEDKYFELQTTKAEFIKQCTENHIRKVLRDTEGLKSFPESEREIPDKYSELPVPKHLYELVTRVQLKKWIDSAIYAMFKYELKKHYVLTDDGKIAPVDATNTGVIQQNMHWNNGLHQFLQIKHGAKITPENLTTNFISNVSFFQRYGANIHGLTGTLGSKDSINLLNKTYSVDSVIIPPFKQKQHHELSPIIVSSEDEWYENIIESTLQKLRHNRGVLIIVRYIDQVDTINDKMLKTGCDPKKIKVYKTQSDSTSVHAELKAGEVIIATNIAGRGTSIKPSSKIEKNGGLHVCLTFLPKNKRVEEQNVGRTSRKGDKGTSQFILLEPRGQSLNKLRVVRNLNDTESLKSAETEIQKVCSKDAIFTEFCKFLDNFDEDKLRTVEERFGIWLQMNADKFETESKETLISLFGTSFKNEMLNDKKSNNLIRNICFHINVANSFIRSKEYEKAITECTKAINSDPEFAEIAYYIRGYCRIARYGSGAQVKTEVEAARDDFIAARRNINTRLIELQIVQRASDGPKLSEQVKNKSNLYNVQLGAIKEAIGLDFEEAKAELEYLNKGKEKAEKENDQTNLKKIKDRIDAIEKEKEEDVGGVIGKALRDNHEIGIEMIDLKESLPSDEDIQYYTDEIDELSSNGLIGNFTISEIPPIPWGDVIAMAFIGLIQIAAGALLTVFTVGAASNFGMSLMLEGVSDLVTAVKDGIIDRNIDWKNWGIQKAVSITVSLVMCGIGGIMSIAKAAQAGVKMVAQGAVISTIKQGVIKEGLKLALKHAAVQLAKGVAKEMTNVLVNVVLEETLMKQIENHLVNQLQPNIYNALDSNNNVKRLLAIDLQNRNQYFQNLICKEALEILRSKKDLGVLDVAKMFATKILNAKKLGLGTVVEVGVGLGELLQFEEKFLKSLDQLIDKIMKDKEKEIKEAESKNVTSGGNTAQSSYKASTQTTSQTSRNLQTSHQTDNDDDLNLDKAIEQHEHATVQQGNVSPETMCKRISERLSNTMTGIIKGKIVMPVTGLAVQFTMNKVFAGVEQSLAQKTEAYRSDRLTNFMLSGDKDNRVPPNIKAGRAKDSEFMDEARLKATKEIDQLKNGGEAGILHMYALSENINQKIVVYDKNGNVWKVINEHLPGASVEVEYHPPIKGKPAHWTLPGGKEPQSTSVGNNCLFHVVADQTDQMPSDLRASTVQTMTNKIDRLAIVMPEVEQVRKYEAAWLMYGGAGADRRTVPKLSSINRAGREKK